MVKVTYSNGFKKSLVKLPRFIQERFYERIRLFTINPQDALLNKHKLHGAYRDFFSINITGNYRAIFKSTFDNTVEFRHIGTHSQLYK